MTQIEIEQWLTWKTPTTQKVLELKRPFKVVSNSGMRAILS